jgi:predicted O-methyltransferase YrrM
MEFLTSLVTTAKPSLIVESGAAGGESTLRLAEGLRANGFGKLVSCRPQAALRETEQRVQAAGLGRWVELRPQSAVNIEGTIDLLVIAGDGEAEIRRWLPQISPFGLILWRAEVLAQRREGRR